MLETNWVRICSPPFSKHAACWEYCFTSILLVPQWIFFVDGVNFWVFLFKHQIRLEFDRELKQNTVLVRTREQIDAVTFWDSNRSTNDIVMLLQEQQRNDSVFLCTKLQIYHFITFVQLYFLLSISILYEQDRRNMNKCVQYCGISPKSDGGFGSCRLQVRQTPLFSCKCTSPLHTSEPSASRNFV